MMHLAMESPHETGDSGAPHPREPSTHVSQAVAPLLPGADVDYARAFQCLVSVQWQIHRQGPGARLILQRAHVRYALGNFLAAALDAGKALSIDPGCVEASFLEGEAFLAMAAMKHGVARPGLGAPPEAPELLPRRRHLLQAASRSFLRVLAAQPQDPQAHEALYAAQALMGDLPGEAVAAA
ncbi:MAG: hypothetical protein ACYDBQ_11650 [Thermoplasmatota archaeon]